jgi:hypothetical protein
LEGKRVTITVTLQVTFGAEETVDVGALFDRVAEWLADHDPNAAVSADVGKKLIEAETSVLVGEVENVFKAGDEARELLMDAFRHAGALGHFAGANYAVSAA